MFLISEEFLSRQLFIGKQTRFRIKRRKSNDKKSSGDSLEIEQR